MKATKEELSNVVALLGMLEVMLFPSQAVQKGLELLYKVVAEIEIDNENT